MTTDLNKCPVKREPAARLPHYNAWSEFVASPFDPFESTEEGSSKRGLEQNMLRRQWNLYLLAVVFVLGLTMTALAGERQERGHHSSVFTTFDFPDASSTNAFDINSAGDIVGDYVSAGGQASETHGYLLSRGRFTSTDFPGPNVVVTSAFGINPRGDIVGRYQTSDGVFHGYLLSAGTFTSIDFSATFTRAHGINARGDIVGRYDDAAGRRHGFLLREDEFTSFDFPGTIETAAWGINPDGEITGRYSSTDGKWHGFLLSKGEFTSIDSPGAFETAPVGPSSAPLVRINPRSDIVGSYCDAAPCDWRGNVHGFLLRKDRDKDEGEFSTLDFPGSIGTAAAGINPRGDIVGTYRDQSGTYHAFLLSGEEE